MISAPAQTTSKTSGTSASHPVSASSSALPFWLAMLVALFSFALIGSGAVLLVCQHTQATR